MNKIKFSHLMTKIFLLTAFLVLGFLNIKAQSLISRYQFASSSGTYTAITGGTVWQSGATLATNAVTNVTLPFTFNFNGTNYTAINISNNGFITFGATAPAVSDYAALSATTSYSGAIVGYGLNLINSTVVGTTPEIRYEQVGSEFIIQFQDLCRTGITGDRMNFQIRLTQTTNTIKIVYGTWTATTTSISVSNMGQVGLRGASNTDYSGRNVNANSPYNTWASSGGSTATLNTNTGTMRYNSTVLPASGLTYTWTVNSTYSALPYTQNFEATPWGNRNSLQDAASNTSMSTFPQLGNPAWKRQDATTANSLWGSTSGALAALTGAQGTGVARFHSYNASTGAKGYMDFYLDFSTSGTKQLTFDYQNTSGTDNLQVALSTDGGLTFSNIGSAYGVAASWTAQTVSSLSSSTSSTVVLRFIATSDFGNDDIGVDNVNVFVPVTPTISGFIPTPNLCLNGGQTVTLTGTNFTGTTAVTFNGVNASSFSVVNSTTITAVTPSSLTAGVITVTTAGGSASSSSYTVVSNPTVAVTPTSNSLCVPGATAVALSASGATTYAWGPAAGLSATIGTSVNALPTSSTTYTVTGTDGNGCTATATSAFTVTAGVSATASASPLNVCNGSNSQLDVAATQISTNTIGAGATNSSSTAASFFPGFWGGAKTQYIIRASELTAQGMVAGNLKSIAFEPTTSGQTYQGFFVNIGSTASTAMTTSFITSGLTEVYAGTLADNGFLPVANAVNTLTFGTGGTASSFYWDGTSNIVVSISWSRVPGASTATASTMKVDAPGFTCSAYDQQDLVTPAVMKASATADATGTSRPKFIFTEDLLLSPTYAWTESPATTLSSTSIANPMSNGITSTNNYTVTVTGAGGCTGTSTLTVNVASSVVCSPITSSNGTSLCIGQNTTLTASATIGGTPYTYDWTADASLSATNIANPVATPTATTTYTCTVTDACGTTCSTTITINVNALPTVGVSPTSGTICNPGGTAVSLTASGTAIGYSWLPATGLSATTGSNVNALPTSSTTYTVTGTDGNGCSATSTSIITVGSAIASTASATPSIICAGDNSQLDVTTNALAGRIKITEVTTFRTGTGATSTYPAYIGSSDQDFVEISNISGSSIDISGWTLGDYASNATATTHPLFSFPSGTIIPANGVSVVHLGTGTNDPANRYFHTGGTNDSWFSTSAIGVVLKNGSTVVDVVGRGNPFVWNVATGVTASDWSGNIAVTSAAGIVRTVSADNNVGTDWVLSTVTQASIGTYNGGYTNPTGTLTYVWSPTTFINSGDELIKNPQANAVSASTTYTVTVTNSAGCSTTSSATVTISSGAAITTDPSNISICENANGSFTVAATGPGLTYQWFVDDGTGFVAITPGAPYSGETSSTLTISNPSASLNNYQYQVEVASTCGSAVTSQPATLTVNTPSAVTTNPSSGLICNPGGTAISVTASGANTYTWAPTSGLTPSTGATVSANPSSTTTYTVTGVDGNGCSATSAIAIAVSAVVPSLTTSATPATICSGNSSTINVNVESVPLSYCSASQSTGTCGTADEFISNVTIGSINNTTTCAQSLPGGYNSYLAQSTAIVAGNSLPISVGNGNYYSGDLCRVYVDWNQDGDFIDAGEETILTGTTTFTGNIASPVGAINGSTRMRVRLTYTTGMAACGVSGYGETEDYTLVVSGGAPSPIVYTYLWNDPNTSTSASTSVSPTVNTNYTVTVSNAAGCTATSFVSVTVSPSSVPTTAGTYTQTFNHADGLSNLYIDPSCNIIANVSDAPTANVLGSTSAAATISSTLPTDNTLQQFIPRYYTITPTSSGAATVTLYFTQGDFTSYNALKGGFYLPAPTTGNNADANISNLYLAQLVGGINGTLTEITPTLNWNSTTSVWECTANLSALGGQYYLFTKTSCPLVVTGLSSGSVTHNSAVLSWPAVVGVYNNTYKVRVKPVSGSAWNGQTITSTTFNSINLLPNTQYEFQVRAACSATEQGAYSASAYFTTLPNPCATVTGLTNGTITSTTAGVSWTNSGATAYNVRIRVQGNPWVGHNPTTSTTYSFVGLTPNTTYEYEVRGVCSGVYANWSATQTFTTSNVVCATVAGLTNGTIGTNSASVSWAATTASSYNVRVRVQGNAWGGHNTTTGTSYTRNYLSPNTTYEYQVRGICSGVYADWSSAQTFTTASLPACATVTGLTNGATTMSTVGISWSATTATAYKVRIRVAGTSWAGHNTATGTTYTFTSLTPGTNYEYQVRGICSGVYADWSAVQTISTSNAPACATVTGLTNGTINPTNAGVSWTATSATSYNVRVRVAGTSWGGHNTTTFTSYTFNYLTANTNYEYQVRGKCSGVYAAWSTAGTFTTGASMLPILFEEESAKAGFVVYPNPTRDQLTIEFSTETLQATKVKVMDMTGRVVKTVEAVPQAGEHQYTLSLSELSAGMYTVQVYTDDKLTHVSKVQKQD